MNSILNECELLSIYINNLFNTGFAGMHLGCAIGQMAQRNCHGRTFWKTDFSSGALFDDWCARLFK